VTDWCVMCKNNGVWVIFSFIVRLLAPFGMHSSIVSVCLGLCLDGLPICLLGDQQAILRVLLFGRWCLCAYCNVFGGKETIGVLRITSCLLFSFNTLYLWTSTYVSPVVISFHVFLAVFAPNSWVASLVYFMCTWGRHTLLIILGLFIQRK
jgi:hypothetical protein